MAKWFEIAGAILEVVIFPLLFAFIVWQTEKAGRRRRLEPLQRWIWFTVVSAATFCVALAVLVLPLRLRLGIPSTNGVLIGISYGAFLSWRLTYYLAMAAIGLGLIGIVCSGIISKTKSGTK